VLLLRKSRSSLIADSFDFHESVVSRGWKALAMCDRTSHILITVSLVFVDTHLSKDRNSGTGNRTKERRHDPRQPEKILPRATATSRKISDRSGKSKHRQTTQAHKPRPTGAHSTKTSTSKSLPALVAACS
jgi:hypothetical protein